MAGGVGGRERPGSAVWRLTLTSDLPQGYPGLTPGAPNPLFEDLTVAQAVTITRQDMHDFLTARRFQIIPLPGVKELVYGRVVDETKGKEICLRIYTSIEGDVREGRIDMSRPVGKDAIRAVLVTKVDGETKVFGADRRVHRVVGWRKNLQDRLDNWREQLGPACPKCGRVTVLRTSRKGPFWGCSAYPKCYSITPFVKVVKKPSRSLAAMVDAVRDGDEVEPRWGSPVQSAADFARECGYEEDQYGERDDSDDRELEANGL